jgi:sirohydrochlorin ferrochelatase
MKFLLLIAHGSRRQGGNHEMERLVERIAGLLPAVLKTGLFAPANPYNVSFTAPPAAPFRQ